MSISESLLHEFDREFATTRKFLALVPDDRLTWKPHAKSMELGKLAWHLSDLAGLGVAVLTTNARTVGADDIAKRKDLWKEMNREKILEGFDTNVKAAREALAKTPDAAWGENWKLVFAGNTVLDAPRAGAFRAVVMNHQVHHRAQLGVYFRLNDIFVPSTYGPSADEN